MMYYVLSGSDENVSYTVSKKNGRIVLARIDSGDNPESLPVTFESAEINLPVQYFCFSRASKRKMETATISRSSLEPAKMFSTSVRCERPEAEGENEEEKTYLDLISAFGDRRSRENVKKRALAPLGPSQRVRFNFENQIFPEFNREATSPIDIYPLESLFSAKTLENLAAIERESVGMCPLLQNIIISESNRIDCNAVDCLYTVLSHKFLKRDSLPFYYSFFYDEIEDCLVGNRLTPLAKDRLLVKLYIFLLRLNNFRLSLAVIPKFDVPRSRIVEILKAMGCSVSQGGIAVLKNPPAERSQAR